MFLKRYLQRISQEVGRRKAEKLDASFAPLDHKAVFNKIYGGGVWGKTAGQKFFSGPGSHDAKVVTPYVESVKHFLAQVDGKPSIVDLGCGDFNVGRQIRPFCGAYVACDVVPGLIAENVRRFAGANVDFRRVDIVDDELPKADVVFLRQVLQHLSNAMISKVLAKLPQTYRYLVLTEDIPLQGDFAPNRDKPTGPGTRTQFGSGVVVEAAPFQLPYVRKDVICELTLENSRLQTIVYQFEGKKIA